MGQGQTPQHDADQKAQPEFIALQSEARAALNSRRRTSSIPDLWNALDAVKDPEIPVVSIWQLGILQNVTQQGDKVTVTITPTYSGCPAMAQIESDIQLALRQLGIGHIEIKLQLAPAWTTDWLDNTAKAALRDYGIAPPNSTQAISTEVACPHCGSSNTELISEFGSTSCKALYKCKQCAEPFDYFKAL
jgi:ring-1,2-phenylacetyl-CoA epoxidase subunit PaaD